MQGQVRDYMRIVLDAIRYCHEMNVVHRDIKVILPVYSHKICCSHRARPRDC